MECSFFSLSKQITCGTNPNIQPATLITTLHSCLDNVESHLSANKIKISSFDHEFELIKSRAGLFEINTECFTICPNHRYLLGKGWKSSKLCMLKGPLQTCNGSRKKEKATLTLLQSKNILDEFGILIPVGAGICRKCRSNMVQTVKEQERVNFTTTSPFHQNSNAANGNGSKSGLELTPEKSCQILSSIQEEEDDVACGSYSLRDRRSRPVPVFNTYESDDNDCTQPSFTDSQGTLWLPNSQSTETSENAEETEKTSSENGNKRKALDYFLQSCGLSPIKKQMKTDWCEASDRTKKDYLIKTKQVLMEVVNVLSPGQGSHLLDALIKNFSVSSDSEMMEILSTAYNLSTDLGTQRQILSLFASAHTFNELSSYIPSLTKYKYSAARKHASTKGIGQPVQASSYKREGLSEHQIKHFIDFVMSPCIMTDSPYLETRLKLSSGEVFKVPQIILNSVRSRVIEQYQSFCKESGVDNVASDRSYMRVLEAIEPNVRKSMKGLDNYAADGAKAVDDMKKIATVFGKQMKGTEWEEDMLRLLSNWKQYMKLEYKMHIAVESEIADHCCQYALSSDGVEHGVLCRHTHDTACISCNDLDEVITEIKHTAEEVQYENEDQKDDIQFTLSQSVKALEEWKKHILRSVNQDQARSDVLGNLTENDVLLERDWAMKFLPMMYRESQSKWFGKRGLNWHVVVETYKKDDDIQSHTIVHVFDNANQDAVTSNAILNDCLGRLKRKQPLLKKVFIRSDNAGCFHSVEGIFSIPCLNQQSEMKVVQIDFADPQGGKSICDRRAAHIKGSIRKYVNEGNNVTTSNEFLNAVVKSNIKNVEIVTAMPPGGSKEKKSLKVKDITSLNNLQYFEDYTIAFKQYKVGNGVKLSNKDLRLYDSFPTIKVINSSSTDELLKSSKPVDTPVSDAAEQPQVKDSSHSTENMDNEHIEEYNNESSLMYTCPEPNCLLTFQKFGNLNKHLDTGIHKFRKDIVSLPDKSKVEYIHQIQSKKSALPKRTVSNARVRNVTLPRGWALKSKRTVKRFSVEQNLYLKEMFQKGEVTGYKCDPEEASVSMRTAKKNGKRRFSQEEFLTATQISSYFSRLALEKRKVAHSLYEDEDLAAEEFENNIIEIKNLATKQDQI